LESGKTKLTSLEEIGIGVISPAIVGIGITTARVTRGLFWSSNIQRVIYVAEATTLLAGAFEPEEASYRIEHLRRRLNDNSLG
jgi:hypothetical protein